MSKIHDSTTFDFKGVLDDDEKEKYGRNMCSKNNGKRDILMRMSGVIFVLIILEIGKLFFWNINRV